MHTRPSSRSRAVPPKEGSYSQKMAGFCSLVRKACAAIHLESPAKGCKQHPYLQLTLQASLVLLDHTVLVAEQFEWQSGPAAGPSFVLGLTQN